MPIHVVPWEDPRGHQAVQMQTGIVVPSAIQAQYALSLLERWSQHPENDVVKGIPRKSISKLADSFKNIGTLTNDEMRTITNVLIPKIVDNPETIRAAIENDTYFHRAFDDALRATGTPSHGDPAVRLALSLQRTVALTEQSRQATEYKNYVVIPFLEIRLSEMADAGFPVPPHIVNIRESHFAQLPVVVDYERAQTHGFLGKADWRFHKWFFVTHPMMIRFHLTFLTSMLLYMNQFITFRGFPSSTMIGCKTKVVLASFVTVAASTVDSSK